MRYNRKEFLSKQVLDWFPTATRTRIPSFLYRPELWLDASDLSTITESSGSVSSWADKSGYGRNATQATGANQPTTGSVTINGLNVLSFDGATDTMTFASGFMNNKHQGTIFSVFTTTSGASTGSPIVFGDDYADFGNRMYTTFGTNSRKNFVHGITLTNVNSFCIVGALGYWQAFINGVSKSLTTTNTVSFNTGVAQFFLANDPPAGSRWGGSLAEIIIYSRALSLSEIETVRLYLKTKWDTL